MPQYDSNECFCSHARFSESSALGYFRQETKTLLMRSGALNEEDFYQKTEISHIPRKSVLKKLVDFENTFAQGLISKFVSAAHQRDESFQKIMRSCRSVLSDSDRKFSCLVILASGSGQLASQILSGLNASQFRNVSEKIYGVDISSTMSASGAENVSDFSDTNYFPVTADCASFEDMESRISELSEDAPVLAVSHGGARYFAKNREGRFLESVSAFPKGSRILVTEVGFELYELMNDLARSADAESEIDVLDSPCTSVSYHHCWNLSYYYFLTQCYTQSFLFRSFFDESSRQLCSKEICVSECPNRFDCMNFIMLEISGVRKQPVYLVDLHRTDKPAGKSKNMEIPFSGYETAGSMPRRDSGHSNIWGI